MADNQKLTFLDDDLDENQNESFESSITSLPEYDDIDKDAMGAAEAATIGIGQGASLGLSPIIAGLTGSGGEVIEDVADILGISEDAELQEKGFKVSDDYEGLQGLVDAYYDQRDRQLRLQQKAAEDQPIISTAANIAGSIPTTIATGGLGGGGRIAQAASKILPKAILPKAESLAGLSTATKAGKMALEGAKAGALTGFGSGEAKLAEGDILETIGETGATAVGGAAVGTAMPFIGSGVKKAAKGIANLAPGVKAFQTGIEAGKKGINITDDESVAAFIEESGKGIRSRISKAFGGETKKQLLDDLDSQGLTVNIKKLKDKALDEIKKGGKSKKEVGELLELATYLDDLDSSIDSTLRNTMAKVERSQAGKINRLQRKGAEVETRTEFDTPFDELSPLPDNKGRVLGVEDKVKLPSGDFKKVTSQQSILQDQIPLRQVDLENVKISEADEIASDLYQFGDPSKYSRNVTNIGKDLRSGIMESIDEAVNGSIGEKNAKLSNIFNTLKSLEIDKNKFMSKNPVDRDNVIEKLIQGASADRNSSKGRAFARAMQYLGQADDKVIKGIQQESDFLTRLSRVSGQYDAEGSTNVMSAAIGAVQKGIAKAGNVAGLASQGLKKESINAKNAVYSLLKDATPQEIQQLTSKMTQKYGESVSPFVNQLTKAANASGQRRTALMYGIYQQPAFRKVINQIGNDILLNDSEVEEPQGEDSFVEPITEGLTFLDEVDSVSNITREPQGVEDVVEEDVISNLINKEGNATLHKKTVPYQGLRGPRNTRVSGSSDFGLYYDSRGLLTGGYGDLITSEEEAANKLDQTEKEARQELIKNYTKAKEDTIQVLSNFGIDPEELSGSQLSGLYVMSFQLGKSGLMRFEKMLNAIKQKDFKRAAKEAEDSLWFKQTPERVRDFQSKILR